MHSRLELQSLLEAILGSRNVYFTPPASIKMSYPAIVYELENIENGHADGGPYIQNFRYAVTVIDKNPDSEFISKISKLPTCSYERSFKSDNLNHTVFSLYY